MNKHDLIEAITLGLNEHGPYVKSVVDAVFMHIEAALARGEDVKISGFGIFKRLPTKARTCRNPRTGETVEVPAGSKVKFKASSKLKV